MYDSVIDMSQISTICQTRLWTLRIKDNKTKSIQAKKQMDSKVQYRGLKSGKNKSDLVAILGQLLKEVLLN